MPVLNKSFRERDKVRVGVVGMLVTLALGYAVFNAGDAVRALHSSSYTAQFTEVGNLKVGSDVRLAGVPVGEVTRIAINGDVVDVGFTMTDDGTLGDATRAAIKAGTALGARFLAVLPAGAGALAPGAVIPTTRTQGPYDITQALARFAGISEQLDKPQLATSMNTISDAFADTPPEFASALDGLTRLSTTIGSRDESLRQLLGNTSAVTDVLAQRSGRLVTILTDGNLLLQELTDRRDAIRQLLVGATATLDQLNGLVADNQQQLGPALDELKAVLDLLHRQDKSLAAAIQGLNVYASSLGEAVGGGPWFFAYVPNLVPSNLAPLLPSLLGQGK